MISADPQDWPEAIGRPLLGANGTEAMSALLPQGGATLVDYLKVGPFMGAARVAELAAKYPLMLHLDDTLSGHQPLADGAVARILDFVAITGTPWTSEHIGFCVADVDLDSALITQPASRALSRDQALTNIVRNASDLAQRLPVSLLLENIPLFPNWAHIHVGQAAFIGEVLEATDCGLLLDLAHARVTADVLGLDVHDYISTLPLERVIEVHLSGPRRLEEVDIKRQAIVLENAQSVASILPFDRHNLIDAHEPMREDDYALLAWLLERTQPQAISLEYYRDPEALRAQLVRLNELIGRPLDV